MSKREEIAQQIELAIVGVVVASKFTEDYDGLIREARIAIMEELSKRGVVIKVDKGLPKMPFKGETRRILIQAGYVAVESLID